MAPDFNLDIFTGDISDSCISGSLSGSFTGSIDGFTGSVINFTGSVGGDISGSYYSSNYTYVSKTNQIIRRSLLKFDLTEISKSLVSGDIVNPKFTLNLKVTEASELPLTYKIYCYPLNKSWEMGDGTFAVGGSDIGVNWVYTNNGDTSSVWYPNIDTTYIPSDNYLDYPSTSSFMRGGGTWYYQVPSNYIAPSSSNKTLLFNLTASNFESQYSSSLQTNLTSSYNGILSSSINAILSSSISASNVISEANVFLIDLADEVYTSVSASISSSLNYTSSVEVTASNCFLNNLSSSLQQTLLPSENSVILASSSYQYLLSISSSLANTLIYSDAYNVLYTASVVNYNNLINAQNTYNAYINFYNNLNDNISGSTDCFYFDTSKIPCIYGILDTVTYSYEIGYYSTDSQNDTITAYNNAITTQSLLNDLKSKYVGYLSDEMMMIITTGSANIALANLSSSLLNNFTSSFFTYMNDGVNKVKSDTYNEVSSSIHSYYTSEYLSDISSGSSLICSQSFDYYQKSDLSVDVTSICKAWIAGAIPNFGFIIVTSDELKNEYSNGEINYYSKETNTIYTPYIDVQWDDSVFSPSDLSPVTSSIGVSVAIKNIKKEYKFGSIVRFDVYARDLYPKKTFSRLQTVYLQPKYLPETSYYAVKDNESNEMIFDFGEYNKLSCDDNGNYFILDTTGLAQERYYRILIKANYQDGTSEIYDNNAVFKVIR